MFLILPCYFAAMEGAATGSKGKGSGDKAPVIVQHLQSAMVKDGEPVTLSCRIIGKICVFCILRHTEIH